MKLKKVRTKESLETLRTRNQQEINDRITEELRSIGGGENIDSDSSFDKEEFKIVPNSASQP